MGILNINEESDTLTYINDIYNVMIGVSHHRLHWPSVTAVGADGSNIGERIAEYLCRQPIITSERDTVDEILLWGVSKFFKRKYDNGLEKKFSTKWHQIDHGWVVTVVDDNTNTHIRCILTRKGIGLMGRVVNGVKSLMKNFRKAD